MVLAMEGLHMDRRIDGASFCLGPAGALRPFAPPKAAG
jgi:hypothetical protein